MSNIAIILMLCCLSFVLGAQYVQGARIKMHLPKSFQESYQKRMASVQYAGGSCTDYEEVDRSSLDLPGKLDNLDKRVRFFRSAIATANLKTFQDVLIPGLGGDDVGDVFAVLRAGGCLPFFYGGAVRDQFLVRPPRDADVEVDCSLDEVMEICRETWGDENCYHKEGSPVAHIGTSGMDVASTNITFYASLCELEYTVNSMAYDTNGNDVIIDLTGTGVDNVCKLQIAIPSDDQSKSSYDCWYDDGGDWILFRAWKLRTKRLDFYDGTTKHYIKTRVDKATKKDPELFAEFYCKTIYDAKYSSDAQKCIVTADQCVEGEGKDCMYKDAFHFDFKGKKAYNSRMLPIMEKAQEDCTAPPVPL